MSIILVWGVILFGAAQLLAPVLSKIFVGYNTGLYAMTLHGFRVYAIAFLIIGINIFGSSFFTALNNGHHGPDTSTLVRDQRYLECDQHCGGADTYHDHYIFRPSERQVSLPVRQSLSNV